MKAKITTAPEAPSRGYILKALSIDNAYTKFPEFSHADEAFDYVIENKLLGTVSVERVSDQGNPGEITVTMTHGEAITLSKLVTHNEYLQDLAKALKNAGL